MTNKKYLSNFQNQDPLSNPIHYKVGDDVEYLGWSACNHRTCKIIRIDTYKWGVRYILQGVKKDGTLGKYTSDADAYTYDYWFNRNQRS